MCVRGVSGVCNRCVSGVCQGCVIGVSGVCQGCVIGVSGVCQGCIRGVSGVCQGCVRGVAYLSLLLHLDQSTVSDVWDLGCKARVPHVVTGPVPVPEMYRSEYIFFY